VRDLLARETRSPDWRINALSANRETFVQGGRPVPCRPILGGVDDVVFSGGDLRVALEAQREKMRAGRGGARGEPEAGRRRRVGGGAGLFGPTDGSVVAPPAASTACAGLPNGSVPAALERIRG
jgi:hypothetical protein